MRIENGEKFNIIKYNNIEYKAIDESSFLNEEKLDLRKLLLEIDNEEKLFLEMEVGLEKKEKIYMEEDYKTK